MVSGGYTGPPPLPGSKLSLVLEPAAGGAATLARLKKEEMWPHATAVQWWPRNLLAIAHHMLGSTRRSWRSQRGLREFPMSSPSMPAKRLHCGARADDRARPLGGGDARAPGSERACGIRDADSRAELRAQATAAFACHGRAGRYWYQARPRWRPQPFRDRCWTPCFGRNAGRRRRRSPTRCWPRTRGDVDLLGPSPRWARGLGDAAERARSRGSCATALRLPDGDATYCGQHRLSARRQAGGMTLLKEAMARGTGSRAHHCNGSRAALERRGFQGVLRPKGLTTAGHAPNRVPEALSPQAQGALHPESCRCGRNHPGRNSRPESGRTFRT